MLKIVPLLLVFYVRNLLEGTRLQFSQTYEEKNSDGNLETFSIWAIIEHLGKSRKEGHYVAYARNSSGIWYKVSELSNILV